MARTSSNDKLDMGFAYNVAKDIANLEIEVESLKNAHKPSVEPAQPQPTVTTEVVTKSGLEVLKFSVTDTFEIEVFQELGEWPKAKITLPESFRNSLCILSSQEGENNSEQIKTIQATNEILIDISSHEQNFVLIKLVNSPDVKTATTEVVKDEKYEQAIKIKSKRENAYYIYLWLAKYITEKYLAKIKETIGTAVVSKLNKENLGDLNYFIESPFYNYDRASDVYLGDEWDEMKNDLRDKKAKLESGEIDPNTAKDFVVPEYPQV